MLSLSLSSHRRLRGRAAARALRLITGGPPKDDDEGGFTGFLIYNLQHILFRPK